MNHAPAKSRAGQEVNVIKHKPIILVVDDREDLRKLLNITLQQQGFDVWLAASGEEALEIYQNHQGVDLVLLDVHMPGLSGPDTCRGLRQLDPDVRCCLMSGDARACDSDLLACEAEFIFEKPLEMAKVVRVLCALLDFSPQPSADMSAA
jgi:CheY-like chemotaxis protein